MKYPSPKRIRLSPFNRDDPLAVCLSRLNDHVDSVILQRSIMKVVDQNGLQARRMRHFREVLSTGMDLQRRLGKDSPGE